jgi:cobalt/nickel transport system permease protein
MHIPDGYLSPSTCAALYAVAGPFWYVALQRVKLVMGTRLVPLLSLFAAFSFVIMMFNLPLPGGTTGHAVGVGIATIVLGPWTSMLAISIALLIQALFFADGGITTYGANCFNMAIVGSLIAYGIYRSVAGRAPLTSTRRVVAAALAGYGAINAAAFCAAVEFGLQPLLFRDAIGSPLYAPFPLRIAIPAMMIGHLTLAGLAESVITGGVVTYLQRTDLSLLKLTAPRSIREKQAEEDTAARSPTPATRQLWMGLAALMILTPLGLLAAGSAWGEWKAEELADPALRAQIAGSSRNQPAPAETPPGLSRLSKIWTAPLAGYAPPFVQHAAVGYLLSAMFGAGLIILLILTASWFFRWRGTNRLGDD